MSAKLPVVVGLDDHPGGLAAVEWAAREALHRDAPLRVVHAAETAPHPPGTALAGAALPPDPRWSERALAAARALLVHRHPGLEVTAERISGDAVTALVDAARNACVLVLGTHGPGRATGLLLGSVSRGVVARAERPVVLVPSGSDAQRNGADSEAADQRAAAPGADVVVGVGPAGADGDVLAFAFDAASRRACGLRVIHGGGLAAGSPSAEELPGVDEAGAASPAPALVPPSLREEFPGVRVSEQAVIGTAGSHLVDASRNAALLVVGRAAPDAPAGAHIGPVTDAVLQHARSPVAVVPHG